MSSLLSRLCPFPSQPLTFSYDSTFSAFAYHLHTNTIGPLITAQQLLKLASPTASTPALRTEAPLRTQPIASPTPIQIKTLVFISSDSGSTQNFRSFEDGFGAYAVSKAALNQGLRHLAAELHRQSKQEPARQVPVVLALHPGEVSTDMAANAGLDWDVEGIIGAEESIGCMLKVIEEKGFGGADEGGKLSAKKDDRKWEDGEASFWTWEGNRYPW